MEFLIQWSFLIFHYYKHGYACFSWYPFFNGEINFNSPWDRKDFTKKKTTKTTVYLPTGIEPFLPQGNPLQQKILNYVNLVDFITSQSFFVIQFQILYRAHIEDETHYSVIMVSYRLVSHYLPLTNDIQPKVLASHNLYQNFHRKSEKLSKIY